MLIWSRTLLRDVLLIWMSKRSASRPLNCVPSKPAVAADQRHARRIEAELVLVPGAATHVAPRWNAAGQVVLEAGLSRYSAGIISSAPSDVEVFRDQRMRVDAAAQIRSRARSCAWSSP